MGHVRGEPLDTGLPAWHYSLLEVFAGCALQALFWLWFAVTMRELPYVTKLKGQDLFDGSGGFQHQRKAFSYTGQGALEPARNAVRILMAAIQGPKENPAP